MFYKVIDDVLPSHVFDEMVKIFCGYSDLPWFLSKIYDESAYKFVKKDSINPDHNFQFVHNFYEAPSPCSDFFKLTLPILHFLKPSALIRVKANLITKTEKIIEHALHIDTLAKNSFTSVFYLNDNNGYTIFENGEKILSKRNRLLIFPSEYFHSGTSCTDEEKRVVLNINYFE